MVLLRSTVAFFTHFCHQFKSVSRCGEGLCNNLNQSIHSAQLKLKQNKMSNLFRSWNFLLIWLLEQFGIFYFSLALTLVFYKLKSIRCRRFSLSFFHFILVNCQIFKLNLFKSVKIHLLTCYSVWVRQTKKIMLFICYFWDLTKEKQQQNEPVFLAANAVGFSQSKFNTSLTCFENEIASFSDVASLLCNCFFFVVQFYMRWLRQFSIEINLKFLSSVLVLNTWKNFQRTKVMVSHRQ